MAHRDLLPTGHDLRQSIESQGLSSTQSYIALSAVSYHLRLWRDYHSEQFAMRGERQDEGAADALEDIADQFGEALPTQAPDALRAPRSDALRADADVRAIIEDSIRYMTVGQSTEEAAGEVLQRLESAGYALHQQ